VYLTLYGGDVIAKDAPSLGPFDDLVIRSARVVGGPATAGRIVAFRGSDGRWLEAAVEERRGVASDAPYARHSHLRLHSADHDLMVRFFAEDKDDGPTRTGRELGPYFAVTIGPQELRADGELLADRSSTTSPWTTHLLSTQLGQAIGGAVLAVRSRSVAHAGEDAPVASPSVPAPVNVLKPQNVLAPPDVPLKIVPAPDEAAARPAFQFIERVKVDPKIYRARAADREQDS
jgi:hypothetical protein